MSEDDRREHLRFDPDQNALAIIHMNGDENESLIGLLRDESMQGCGAVFHEGYFPFDEGDVVQLKVHRLDPQPSEIAWTEHVDEKLVKVGFKYETESSV